MDAAAQLRIAMPALLARHIAGDEAQATAKAKAIMDEYSDEQIATVAATLMELGSEQRLYLANRYCRAMVRQWIGEVFIETGIKGGEHLRNAKQAGNTVLICNHQSYIDTTATDAVLFWHGYGDIADRVVAVAGPKVYEDPFRRVATSALNTLPVPQSSRIRGRRATEADSKHRFPVLESRPTELGGPGVNRDSRGRRATEAD
ncbi:MAG: hypothetical protein HN348_12875, partial [Proteobacteria bacterium]|nr:hypothetical protein [Pseudomonadota bacterium]